MKSAVLWVLGIALVLLGVLELIALLLGVSLGERSLLHIFIWLHIFLSVILAVGGAILLFGVLRSSMGLSEVAQGFWGLVFIVFGLGGRVSVWVAYGDGYEGAVLLAGIVRVALLIGGAVLFYDRVLRPLMGFSGGAFGLGQGVRCVHCGRWSPVGTRFCGGCGEALPLVQVCARCGKVNAEGAVFCGFCGGRLRGDGDAV